MMQAVLVTLFAFLLALFGGCSNDVTTSTPSEQHTSNSAKAKPNQQVSLVVHKSPTCGCCGAWVDQIKQAGFNANIVEDSDLQALKDRFGIVPQARACHTATYKDKYVFEGHVPPASLNAFLSNPPADAKGLVVPGMPVGSAGMEDGDRFQPFKVLQLNNDGSYSVYASIESYEQQF